MRKIRDVLRLSAGGMSIGNWLHTDGLMARLKDTGIFAVLEFPLLREDEGTEIERCTWKAKYPTQEAIDAKRNELGSEILEATDS